MPRPTNRELRIWYKAARARAIAEGKLEYAAWCEKKLEQLNVPGGR